MEFLQDVKNLTVVSISENSDLYLFLRTLFTNVQTKQRVIGWRTLKTLQKRLLTSPIHHGLSYTEKTDTEMLLFAKKYGDSRLHLSLSAWIQFAMDIMSSFKVS